MSDENNINEITEQNNQNISENGQADKEITTSNVNVLKFVLIIIAIFLGTFAAVYTIVDMTMYRLGFQPFKFLSRELNRTFDDEFKYMKSSDSSPVKIETKANEYVVTINMKAFGNDINNVDMEVLDNGIKIKGMYFIDKKSEKRENSFYQKVIFPVLIDEENVKKEVKGNKMIIKIPFKDISVK